MIVKDVMRQNVATCTPSSNLASVVDAMRERDCAFLPVVDSHHIVVGVVTDRDVCFAAGREARPARVSVRIVSSVGLTGSVSEVMSRPVFSCTADEDIRTVLATMARHHVKRLPVLTRSGQLEGVLSMDDIVSAAPRRDGPTAEEIVTAWKAVCASRPIEAHPERAS